MPLVLRTQGGAGSRSGAQHSQSLEAWLTHVPGLKVVMPSSAADAAGLLRSAIADPDPVVFVENNSLYFRREPASPTTPGRCRSVGAANGPRGDDMTIVATSRMVGEARAGRATGWLGEGIQAEVIDPRTLVPLDIDTIAASVRRTGRAVIAHEAVTPAASAPSSPRASRTPRSTSLEAPIQRVGAPFTPVPVSPPLEDAYRPGAAEIHAAARIAIEWDWPEG